MDEKQKRAAGLADARAELDRLEKTNDDFVLMADISEEDAHKLIMVASDVVFAQAALSIFRELDPDTRALLFQIQLKELAK